MKSVRFPDDLAARVQAHADAVDRSFSYLVVKATEQASKEWREVVAAVEAGAEVRVEAGSTRAPVEKVPEMRGLEVIANISNALHDDPTRPLFECPVARCGFRAKSPAAVCAMHGKKVVPT